MGAATTSRWRASCLVTSGGSRRAFKVALPTIGRPGMWQVDGAAFFLAEPPSTRGEKKISILSQYLPTLSRTHPRLVTWSAMCVRRVDAQCVPQFTSRLAAGCVLHRPASRVIHRLEWLNVSHFSLQICFMHSLRNVTELICLLGATGPGEGRFFEPCGLAARKTGRGFPLARSAGLLPV